MNDIKLRSGFRKLQRSNGLWQYKIGVGGIVIFTPENKRILTNQSKVSGLSWDNLERGYWKRWFKGITPKHIDKFIDKL
jgi:hypothetical protein|tara:strand:+ start:2758 stop:2994 length:237 start_codon:yes stop_codon:yes gene_type:complete